VEAGLKAAPWRARGDTVEATLPAPRGLDLRVPWLVTGLVTVLVVVITAALLPRHHLGRSSRRPVVATPSISHAGELSPAAPAEREVLARVVLDSGPAGFVAVPEALAHGGYLDVAAVAQASPDNAGAVRESLTEDRFTGGYRRAWVSPDKNTVVVDTLLSFEQPNGAASNKEKVLLQARLHGGQEIDPGGIPNASAYKIDQPDPSGAVFHDDVLVVNLHNYVFLLEVGSREAFPPPGQVRDLARAQVDRAARQA
jgi:hypothetical protein